MKERPLREIFVILGMLLSMAIPVALTQATVRVPPWAMHIKDNPTPYGYTVSLLLFLVPIFFVAQWHIRKSKRFDQKAFLWSAAVMAGIGTVLDIAFGYHFFEFPNTGATLGIRIRAWDWSTMSFVPDYLPVEEFGFYILGAIFMAAVYLWAGQNWVSQYERDDYDKAAELHPGLIQVSLPVVVFWLMGLAMGVGYGIVQGGGIPGYFLFVWVAGLLPTVALVRALKDFVNWHAMAFTFIALVFASIIWEASLAVPYLWWTYRPEQMLGIFIPGWANLPLEAVLVWCIGVWDAVLIYEFFRVFQRKEAPVREILFGARKEASS
jgi:hypothetical protein